MGAEVHTRLDVCSQSWFALDWRSQAMYGQADDTRSQPCKHNGASYQCKSAELSRRVQVQDRSMPVAQA